MGVPRNRTGQHRWRTNTEVGDLIRGLARQQPDSAIAAKLNRMGKRTGRGHAWTEARVRSFRNHHAIAVYRSSCGTPPNHPKALSSPSISTAIVCQRLPTVYRRQTTAVLVEGLERAFEWFSGVPQEHLFDPMRAVAPSDGRAGRGKLVLNAEFLRQDGTETDVTGARHVCYTSRTRFAGH